MSDQEAKQENKAQEPDLSQENMPEDGSDSEGQAEEKHSLDNAADLSNELDGFLDESDDFQEIDLFDEGLLDDLDAGPGDESAVSQAEAAPLQTQSVPDEGSPDAGSDQTSDLFQDDLASEIADDIAADIQQDIQADIMQDAAEPVHEPGSPSESETAVEDGEVQPGVEGSDSLLPEESVPEEPVQAADKTMEARVSDMSGAPEPEIKLEPVEPSAEESESAELPDAPPAADVEAIPADDAAAQAAPSDADRDAFGDDLGISLSDDELWDDSPEDDIPLFDDEPEEQSAPDQAEGASSADRGVEESASASPAADKAVSGRDLAGQDDSGEAGSGGSAAPEEDGAGEDVIVVGGAGPSWLPFAVSGFASIILLGGLFVLWGMLSSTPDAESSPDKTAVSVTSSSSHNAVKKQDRQSAAQPLEKSSSFSDVTPLGDVPPLPGGQSLEAFDLAPFIIPVMRQGELVFFKLTVELIVPDMKTKQELKKREAWVRDAIYTELKGIEVGPGTKGEFLLNYRRPLKQRIEKELAPLKIRDVRLMGYVLK